MESNKNFSSESGKSSTGNPSATPTSHSPTSSSTTGHTGSPTSSPTSNPASSNYSSGSNPGPGQSSPTTGSAPQRAREQSGTGQSPIDQTKQVVTDAYGKTSEALTNTYDQAMSFGREHPGQLTLIAFGAGIGIGLLLASSFSSGRSTSQRYAEPVVNALSNIALEFFRNR